MHNISDVFVECPSCLVEAAMMQGVSDDPVYADYQCANCGHFFFGRRDKYQEENNTVAQWSPYTDDAYANTMIFPERAYTEPLSRRLGRTSYVPLTSYFDPVAQNRKRRTARLDDIVGRTANQQKTDDYHIFEVNLEVKC